MISKLFIARSNGENIIFMSFMLLLISFLSLSSSSCNVHSAKKNIDSLFINIHYLEAKPGDSITLALQNILYEVPESYNFGKFTAYYQNGGWFKFRIPVLQDFGYWCIYKSRTFTKNKGSSNNYYLLLNQLWQRGDRITITLSNKETYAGIYSTCSYSGKDSLKYTIYHKVDSVITHPPVSKAYGQKSINKDSFDHLFHKIDNKYLLAYLNEKKRFIPTVAFQLLKSKIFFFNSRFRQIKHYYNTYIVNGTDSVKNGFIQAYNSIYGLGDVDLHEIPTDILKNSPFFLNYIYQKFLTESYLAKNVFNPDYVYKRIKQGFSGDLRDRLILYFFLKAPYLVNRKGLYSDAKTFISDSISLKTLGRLARNDSGGSLGDFTMQNPSGQLISLSSFKGKVVVMDFWFNGCGGCSLLFQNVLKKIERKYADSTNFAVVSINADLSKDRWIKGINNGHYTSKRKNTVNLYTNGKGPRHSFLLRNNIYKFPTVVVIDKHGTIRYFDSKELYQYKSLSKIIRRLLRSRN